jgi:hypothetical protein
MSYYDIPERRLDPPDEDEPQVVYTCELCGHDILEGDDYYDLPDVGPCCEECIIKARRFCAELD